MSTQVPKPDTTDPAERWRAYWQAQGQPWRTELEIDTTRQEELAQHRATIPDIEKGVYSFKNMKLSRADVEWLLATHDDGYGPINWNDERQRKRKKLDLRGAILREVDLSFLPLAGMYGGLTIIEWTKASEGQQRMAAIQLQGANLSGAELQLAQLNGAQLQKTQLMLTQLEGAYLGHAHLQKADLSGTKLHEAYLYDAEIQEANLNKTELQGAYLVGARLQGACLRGTHLEGTDLRESFFDTTTQLINVTLGDETVGSAKLADIHWGDTNLAVVDWLSVKVLGDESEAQKQRKNDEKDRLTLYRRAVRANRQLATVLQSQGLNEDAAHFAYHAQYMQRIVFRLQKKFGRYLGSLILDLVAGYGYRWRRAFLTYLLIVTAFATAYFIIGGIFGPALSPLSAFVFSMTSFHGRGFFPGGIGLDDPLTILAALEAFVGLLIEVTFIATLTQRLFGK